MQQGELSFFCCPVCSRELRAQGGALVCGAGHSFDLSRHGYVNLLMNSSPAEKRHGDDAMMARARTAFLEKGYYDPLSDAVCEALKNAVAPDARVLDCGCGECFYTERAARSLPEAQFAGIDISRASIIEGAKRRAGIRLAVASAAAIPVASGSCGAVINLFAPAFAAECRRILDAAGILIRVVPTEKHLWELKAAIYDEPYENRPSARDFEGFAVRSARRLDYRISLSTHIDIDALFRMTPYYYKTSAADQQKLSSLSSLETQVGFEIIEYEKSDKTA